MCADGMGRRPVECRSARLPGLRRTAGRAGGRESVRTGRTDHYVFIEGCFDVLGGSMGAVHGERVVRAYRRATELGLPVVVLASSGGARMQEGMVSLIQMARTAAAAAGPRRGRAAAGGGAPLADHRRRVRLVRVAGRRARRARRRHHRLRRPPRRRADPRHHPAVHIAHGRIGLRRRPRRRRHHPRRGDRRGSNRPSVSSKSRN